MGSDVLSILLTVVAAVLTHCSVRYAKGFRRSVLFMAAIFVFAAGIPFYEAGFWPAFYTLMSLYMLACIALPWLDFCWRRRHVG